MHGLILRAIQCFLRDIWGAAFWKDVATDARLPPAGFEAMLTYDPALGLALVDAAAARLHRSRDSLLEDLGNYLVSHPRREGVRRLLRFGGADFTDFLHSLGHLPGRVRLAVPDLILPALTVQDMDGGRFCLAVAADAHHDAFVCVLLGLIRAMADDYGALALIDRLPDGSIGIEVLDGRHATARDFHLVAQT